MSFVVKFRVLKSLRAFKFSFQFLPVLMVESDNLENELVKVPSRLMQKGLLLQVPLNSRKLLAVGTKMIISS